MRCSEIASILREYRLGNLTSEKITALKNHLTGCPDCQEHYINNSELDANLRLLDKSVRDNPIPIEVMRQRIEAVNEKSSRLMPLGITGSIAALLLIVVVSLFNLGPEKVVKEYEVSFEGVEPRLIENDETICQLLETNGLVEAGYDVTGCQKTCAVVVYNLRTKKEAELVVELFHQIAPQPITSEIIPI